MIGDVIHEQGNYKETVIAEQGDLVVIDCTIGNSTLLLRVKPSDRLHNPLARKLLYDAATIQRILESVRAVENHEEYTQSTKR